MSTTSKAFNIHAKYTLETLCEIFIGVICAIVNGVALGQGNSADPVRNYLDRINGIKKKKEQKLNELNQSQHQP